MKIIYKKQYQLTFDRKCICCFTGHRPEKLSQSAIKIKKALKKEIERAILEGINVFISGMARGVDLWAAELVLEFKKKNPKIMLICAIPYKGFEKNWSIEWRNLYCEILSKADLIRIFYTSFNYAAFDTRNRYMVDHSGRLIAVYNGKKGGTRNTILYAKKQKIRIYMIKDI